MSINTKGKLIDTWVYDVKDVELEVSRRDPNTGRISTSTKVVSEKVELKVYLHKDTQPSREAPYPVKAVEFSIVNVALAIEVRGTDLEILRYVINDLLDKKFAIEWEEHYLVGVRKAETRWSEDGAGVSLDFKTVEKGVTQDGKFLLREGEDYRGRDIIKPWPPEGFKDDNGKSLACIPATKENTEALKQFVRRINQLRKLMTEAVSQSNIGQTLSNMSSMKLLPETVDTKRTCDDGK